MKVSEPIGNAAWGAFFVRIALGMFLILKGLNEIEHIQTGLKSYEALNHIPVNIRPLITVLFPYLQVVSGALLLVGFWTTLASFVAAIILFAFIYGVGISRSAVFLNKDTILLAAAISLLYSGAGAFSIDRFRKSA